MQRYGLTITLLTIFMAVLLVGCKGPKRNESLSGEGIIRATNDAGVAIAISNIKQNRGHLVLNVDISNNGEQVVELRNPGDLMRGFTITSEGRSASASARHGGHWGPWVGFRPGMESSAAGVMELAPGSTAGLALHFRWDKPYPERHNYPWTLTINQMYVKGTDQQLPAIVHSEPEYQ